LGSELNYGKKQIQWRRARVLELSSQGNTQHEIAQRLQVAVGTVNSDLTYLRKQAQENLEHHIHEIIPFEYHKAMIGMKHNLKQTLEIAETVSDPKTKLQARSIVNDCYKYIIDLITNGSIITDAIKYVTEKQEKIDTLRKLDERIEALQEDEPQVGGVF
jgi:DNA-binding transcriptional regulator LsrR (DeoR family)